MSRVQKSLSLGHALSADETIAALGRQLDQTYRAVAADLVTSFCAVLVSEACNIGLEPLVRNDVPSLRRARLSWVNQNFIRNETLAEANACLVAEQNRIPLVQQWGG